MEINNLDEYHLDFNDLIPVVQGITNSETRFVREYLWKLKIDCEENEKITITTNSIEFSYFLVDVIRSYNDRHSK